MGRNKKHGNRSQEYFQQAGGEHPQIDANEVTEVEIDPLNSNYLNPSAKNRLENPPAPQNILEEE